MTVKSSSNKEKNKHKEHISSKHKKEAKERRRSKNSDKNNNNIKPKRLFESKEGGVSSKEIKNDKMNPKRSFDGGKMDVQSKEIKADKSAKLNNKALLATYVHRIKHISTKPSTILKIAVYSHGQNENSDKSLLAVSRDDGTVELLQYNKEILLSLALLPGFSSLPLDNLACCVMGDKYKFVGASSKNNSFYVVDFEQLTYTNVTSSNGGSILCMKSFVHANKCYLACGCEDGFIRIWDVTNCIVNNNKPIFVWTLPTAGNAILSLTVKKTNDTVSIFASVADATIRKYNYTENVWKQKFRSTLDTFGSETPTRVWCIQSIPQKNMIVTGDSYGQVQYWNDETGLLLGTILQNEHKVALYDIAISDDGDKVYATGVDSKIICMEYNELESMYVRTTSKLLHTHDIKTMILHNKTLYTGGLDTKLGICNDIVTNGWIYYKLHDSLFYYQKKIQLSLSNDIVCYHNIHDDNSCLIESFRLVKHDRKQLDGIVQSCKVLQRNLQEKEAFSSKLKLEKLSRNIVSCAISQHGDLLLFCTLTQVGLFYMHVEDNELAHIPLIVGKDVQEKICGSSAMQFLAGDGRYLICITTKEIVMVQIQLPSKINFSTIQNDIQINIVQVIPLPSIEDTTLSIPIYKISISNDNKWFALLQYSLSPTQTINSSIHIYQINPDNKLLSHYWVLHPLSTTTITIYNDTLLLSNTKFTLYMYDLNKKRLSDWNQDNNMFHSAPKNFHDCIGKGEYPIRIIPIGSSKCIMASYNFFHIIDLDLGIPNDSVVYPCKKIKTEQERNFTICKRYQSMLHINYSDEKNELVVIELNKDDIVKRLCDPLERKEYGT